MCAICKTHENKQRSRRCRHYNIFISFSLHDFLWREPVWGASLDV